MLKISFTMSETLFIAVILLMLGMFIKDKVALLKKYFIPAPVIGGVIFSIISLIGYQKQIFMFTFDGSLQALLMIGFFTSVGFLASIKVLKKGGVQVFIFLLLASVLAILQDGVGISLAKFFGINPLIGLATGSVPLTGGHGTSAAFGPELEKLGATGATAVAIASATFGLVAGCLIGGPLGKRLMQKYKLVGNKKEDVIGINKNSNESSSTISEKTLFNALIILVVAVGIGGILSKFIGKVFTLPAYIGPMLIAALVRNIFDSSKKVIPLNEISIIGNTCLSLFLSMALMSMKLWELAALALPLIVILLIQTTMMFLFAYFITFRIMGKDYDAAVIATGHCGFGLGATPNAMANMESFTAGNGPSPRAFFVLPLVGALFIDFTNATIITFFMNIFK